MLKATFDFEAAEVLAGKLDRLTGRAGITLAAIDSVNVVTKRADASLRRGENAGINLTDTYVKSKTDLALAVGSPFATITTRGDLTILGRYPIAHIWQPAGPARQNAKRGTVAGGPSKGDPKRGIPAGSKQKGLRVDIKRSAPVYESKWFTMTLRRGQQAGDTRGVFVRTSAGPVKHIYGPSPYSLFRHQVMLQIDDITADLERETLRRMGDLVEGGLR